MNTKKTTDIQISAFVDGELNLAEHEQIFAALRRSEAQATWNAYHHIGDVLRSSDNACGVRADFSARMAAALAAEPNHIWASRIDNGAMPLRTASRQARHVMRRFALPGAAVAAAVVLSVAIVPRIIDSGSGSAAMLVQSGGATVLATAESAMARDGRIDAYLQAHQRFAPSVYYTAQYARANTFSTEAGR